ncbi:hypothetical protein CCM_08341 [Cordyceps militaris CM01]|uniref:Uncharacterized protein n=1 Tax=Cordyceps militaris (strain CM01) TaxID=983644 RepID=G3JTF1_CORMM|nr:uncharacterized protein CCM_08341 [Cordyceps militaris CM01]EGX88298.1 hypothetical protein CCM_08341 [Cordyceps militaris CM01]
MARDTTPLLPRPLNGPLPFPVPHRVQDHAPHLRACHSPWNWMPQRRLVNLRGLALAFLTSTGVGAYWFKFTEFRDHSIWFLAFHFGTIAYVLAVVFHLIVFGWAFTHLYYPDGERFTKGVESLAVRAFSLPSNLGSPRKQFWFHFFYTTTTVFAFMSAALYWLVTRPHNPQATMVGGPITDLLGEGWFKSFAMFTLYTTPAITMLIETIFFNSIKTPQSLGSHVLGLVSMSGLYLPWAALGGHLTGCYPFFWLNPDFVGSKEAVALYCLGFLGLAPLNLVFLLKQVVIALRERMTRSPPTSV